MTDGERLAEAHVYGTAYKAAYKDARSNGSEMVEARLAAEKSGASAVASFRRTR